MTNPFAPPGESPFDLWRERALLNGIFLGTVAYGVHLTVFILCSHFLLQRRKKTRMDWFLIAYTSILFGLGNVGNALNIKLGEDVFINKRNYPGGPYASYTSGDGMVTIVGNVVYIINLWFQDGLLLWRFYMFFASRGRWYFVVLPSLMFLTAFALSLALIAALCTPGNTLFSAITAKLVVPYWAISIALNILITTCIAARLLYMRHRIKKVTGGGSEYVSITAMLVESAFLYSANGLIFLVSYALDSPVQNLALAVQGQMQCIAPMLIILRVLQGRAWSANTLTTFEGESTSIRFQVTTSEAAKTNDSHPTLIGQKGKAEIQMVME